MMFYLKRDVPKVEKSEERTEELSTTEQGLKDLHEKVETIDTMVKTIIFNTGDDN